VKQSIGYLCLVVRDYAAAIDFYVNKPDFTLVEDKPVEAQKKRWVLLAPPVAVFQDLYGNLWDLLQLS
jgi:catechol 2,3-dioxygenase-like lactoylglutathione lyase family enzyme